VTQRIVVTGSECTGKTSLAQLLAAHIEAPWLPEASRAYATERLRGGEALTAADVEPIARRTLAAEDAALAGAPAFLVLDTDLISTVVYARHYYGVCPSWIEVEARARRGTHYLLCTPDLPWLADGVRDRPADRAAMHALFHAALEEFETTFTVVSGAGGNRTSIAVGVADALTAGAPLR
jgi:NadR type nicotinamide-nucleotide adenylyltransferase